MKKQIFNPYLPENVYIPDVEPHVFGDRLYIYGSHDTAGGDCFCPLDYECWSAPLADLSDWRNEGIIYRAVDCPHYSRERQDLYAPDVVQGNDGRYYLYYDLSGRKGKHGFDGPISVAVCDTPAGKFEYYGDVRYESGEPMRRFIPFDPAVLNDNGRIYLSYGWGLGMNTHAPIMRAVMPIVMHFIFNKPIKEILKEEPLSILGANVVELCDDMLTVKGEPKRILPAMNNTKSGSELHRHSFYEAASLRKINGLYYFIYSSHVNHELCYATSKFPDRDFVYRGVIISNGDIGCNGRRPKDRLYPTGTNHGSIECINGEYYIFYHRMTHNSPFSRQGCAQKIEIEPDGSIKQVEMTSCGLNSGNLKAQGEYPAAICCNLTNGKMPHITNVTKPSPAPHICEESGRQFVKDITDGTLIGYKYFDFNGETALEITARGSGGVLEIFSDTQNPISKIDLVESSDWTVHCSQPFTLSGEKPLYFKFHGKGKIDLLKFAFKA